MFDFDDEALDQLDTAPEEEQQEPVLVCFYSGGFTHEDGVKLIAPLKKAVAEVGIGDVLVLGHPDHYGIESEGYEGYAAYVDALVDELDEEAYRGRPLLLFGHSRGACPATCLASRLGDRVKKVYICACGAIQLGKPTGWEEMSKGFKAGGVMALLKWFSSLQPGNLLLERTANLPEKDIPAALDESAWLKRTVGIMKVQYMDACYPQMMGDDPLVKQFATPMLVQVSSGKDAGNLMKHNKPWEGITTGPTEFKTVDQGHMDCLDAGGEWLDIAVKDIAKFVPSSAS